MSTATAGGRRRRRRPLRPLERAAAAEDGQSGEEPLFVGREQVVRPGDHRPQRLLSRVGVAAGREQVESLRDPLQDLGGCEHAHAGGGELERQRQVVEPAAQLGNRLLRLDARPGAEQLDRLRLGESRHRVDDLALDAQQLPAGDEQAQVRTGPQQRRQLDRRLDHLLQVVGTSSSCLSPMCPASCCFAPSVCAIVSTTSTGSRTSASPTQNTPAPNSLTSSPAASSASRVFPVPPGPASVTSRAASSRTSETTALTSRSRPTNEESGTGQVRVRDRPQRRKALGPELVQQDLLGEVLQPMPAQVEHVLGDQLAGRSREQHLAAVGGAHDPGRLVHVRADVLGRIKQRLARVHTNPDPHRPLGKRRHRLPDRRDRTRRRAERVEQPVARVIDLVPEYAPKASRKTRRWSASASLKASAPSPSSSTVEPSMSVNTNVTVPAGCTATEA